MDATQHKHPSVEIKSYPTLKLYLKGKKDSPLDIGFKAGRTKQSLVEYIEEHRVTSSDTKKKETNKKKEPSKTFKPPSKPSSPPSQASSTKSQQGQSANAPPQASGFWIFDDSADPESRGQALSNEMANSQNGYTLVQVGDIGLLLPPSSGSPRAVRRFTDAAALKAFSASLNVQSSTEASLSPRALLCPADADLQSCKGWCQGVLPSPEVQTALGGKSCKELSEADSPNERPSCMCYDKDYTVQLAMCVSTCPVSSSCSATGASCDAGADKADPGASETRYLLYDTKYGEGFNLQREVYPRAGWIVATVNKALDEKCGGSRSGACARWVLVLPPWCQVVHWWTGPDHVPWATFFDGAALKGSQVPVIEFHEYVNIVGKQKVNLAVAYETEELVKRKASLKGGSGKFAGFAPIEECKTRYTPAPSFEQISKDKVQLTYAGQCEGGIVAKEFLCAGLDGPWPQGVVDMVSSLNSSVKSVLMKNYDYLLSPENNQLDDLGLRESMLFSAEIRNQGEQFISSALKGETYLAAHCRRTDFLTARKDTTPDVGAIAAKLNAALQKTGLKQVFIATDAPDDLKSALKTQVEGRVLFYDDASLPSFDHKGKQGAVEIWIAARADFFIGTIESRFTMAIQLERSFLGHPQETSEQEFCKDFKPDGKPCLVPSYRHVKRAGAHRQQYQPK